MTEITVRNEDLVLKNYCDFLQNLEVYFMSVLGGINVNNIKMNDFINSLLDAIIHISKFIIIMENNLYLKIEGILDVIINNYMEHSREIIKRKFELPDLSYLSIILGICVKTIKIIKKSPRLTFIKTTLSLMIKESQITNDIINYYIKISSEYNIMDLFYSLLRIKSISLKKAK